MKRYITRLMLFLLFAVVFYVGAILFIGTFRSYWRIGNLKYNQGSSGHLYTRLKDLRDYSDVDILVIGASHAYRGFDPRIFKDAGWEMFNLGSSRQTPIQTELLLKRHLDQLDPEIFIMVVSPLGFVNDGVEPQIDLISNGPVDDHLLDLTIDLRNITTINSLLLASFRQYVLHDTTFQEPREAYDDIYVEGGFVERTPAKFRQRQHGGMGKWQPMRFQLDAFERIMTEMAARNIEVMLVQTPVTSLYLFNKGERQRMADYFGRYGTFIDMGDIFLGQDSLYFYDGHHLNQQGVIEFNRRFIEQHLPPRPASGR